MKAGHNAPEGNPTNKSLTTVALLDDDSHAMKRKEEKNKDPGPRARGSTHYGRGALSAAGRRRPAASRTSCLFSW